MDFADFHFATTWLALAAPAAGAANPFPTGAPASGNDGQRPEEVAIKNFFIRSGVVFEATTGSTLAYDGTNLIVTQNRKNLDRVRNILRRYSDIKQVHIEAKFMEVSEASLNELSTNWRLSQVVNNTTIIRAQSGLRSVNDVFGSTAVTNNGNIASQTTVSTVNPITNLVTQTTTNINTATPSTTANQIRKYKCFEMEAIQFMRGLFLLFGKNIAHAAHRQNSFGQFGVFFNGHPNAAHVHIN